MLHFRAFSKNRCVFGEHEYPPVVNILSTCHFWLRHDAKDEDMDNVLESPIDQPLGQKLQCWNHPSIKAPACEMSWQMIHIEIYWEFTTSSAQVWKLLDWFCFGMDKHNFCHESPSWTNQDLILWSMIPRCFYSSRGTWLPGFFIKDFISAPPSKPWIITGDESTASTSSCYRETLKRQVEGQDKV